MKYYSATPGKVIISGEHAIVYGYPAIVTTINKYAHIELYRKNFSDKKIRLDLKDYKLECTFDIQELALIKKEIKNRYEKFLTKKLKINQVLTNPTELILYTIQAFLEGTEKTFEHSVKFKIFSEIPIGCGLGSSAALIVNILKVLNKYFNTNLNNEELYKIALECENLQHGKSSGGDVYTVLNNGCFKFHKNKIHELQDSKIKWQLINTGKPILSTGECVSFVAKRQKNTKVWNVFEKVTHAVEQSLINNNEVEFKNLIKENHKLLNEIGVVTSKTKEFVKELEDYYNGSAKVCGAGCTKGEKNGVLLVISDKNISKLIKKFDYELLSD